MATQVEDAQSGTEDIAGLHDMGNIGVQAGEQPNEELQYALVRRWKENQDHQALEMLYEMHGGFIKKMALGWAQYAPNLEEDDFLQHARIGFLEGVNRYDRSQGKANLVTYAKDWMYHELSTYLKQNKIIHKRPAHIREAWQGIVREYKILLTEHNRQTGGRPFTIEDKRAYGKKLQERLGKEESKKFGGSPVDVWYRAEDIFTSFYGGYDSLNVPSPEIDDGNSEHQLYQIRDEAVSAQHLLQEESLSEFLESILQSDILNEKERGILRARTLTSEEGEALTQDQIAKKAGVSRQRVSQIEELAELKVRSAVRDKILSGAGFVRQNEPVSLKSVFGGKRPEANETMPEPLDNVLNVASVLSSRMINKGSICYDWIQENNRSVLLLDQGHNLKGAIVPGDTADKLLKENPIADHFNVLGSILSRNMSYVTRLFDSNTVISLENKKTGYMCSYVSPDLVGQALELSDKPEPELTEIFEKAEPGFKEWRQERARLPSIDVALRNML